MIELDEGAARSRHDGQDQRGKTESDQDDAIHGGEYATHYKSPTMLLILIDNRFVRHTEIDEWM